jgi:hypothetical protein
VTSRVERWWVTLKTWVLLSATAQPSLLADEAYVAGRGPGRTVVAE